MSLVEKAMKEATGARWTVPHPDAPGPGVRIPMRYVADWSVRANPVDGAHIELVLDGVPLDSLLVLINELKAFRSSAG